MELPENFYKLVEQPGFLKNILYGDSVSKNSKIIVRFKNHDYYQCLTFNSLWSILVEKYNCKVVNNGNEYIFITDEFQSVSFNVETDQIIENVPQYIMRHKYCGTLCRLSFTNYGYLDVTKSHSMLDYDPIRKCLVKKTPKELSYVPVMRNQFEYDEFFDLNFLLLGLFIGDGTYGHTKYDYPRFSVEKREETILFLNECGLYSPIYVNNNNSFDFSINDQYLIDMIKNNNLEKIKSENRILTNEICIELSKDINKFVSFFTGYWLADGTYTSRVITYCSSNLPLLEQLQNILLTRGIYSHIKIDKNGRNYKSKIKGDMYQLSVVGVNTSLFESLESVQHLKKCGPLELRSSFYGKGTSKKGNLQITRKEELSHLKNIKPVRIISKEEIKYNDYVYDLSFARTQNFFANGVLVHNTDSIFLSIPMKDAKNLPIEKRWEIAEKSAEEINKLIVDFVVGTLLPRCNIQGIHNQTFFKTELLIDSAMFLDVKKNYAYKLSCKEGVVIDPPKVKYTGIQVIKSDAAKLTQNLLKDMIEKVMLNENIKRTDRQKEIVQIVQAFHNKFVEDVTNYQFSDIGFPGKWSKKDLFIKGMMIYNFIMQEEVFNLGSSGKFLYCGFNDQSIVRKAGMDEMKSFGICVPYEYDISKVRERMEQNQIYVDQKLHWSKLFTTTCTRVVELAKAEAKNLSSLL